jgi:hypothetical protein
MLPRTALAALAVLATALAGCTGSPGEEIANASREEQAQAGQGEFARALEDRFHTHNYWGGPDSLEKVLMDADVASSPLLPFDAANPLRLFGSFGFFNGPGAAFFELPEGSIVPPESERVEITVTWAESPTITGLGLYYRTAASKDWEGLGTLASGAAVVVPTNLTTSDMPHAAVSKWRFLLYPESDQGFGGVFNGTAHVTIKAFRNNTLYLAPPHPDWWGSDTTKVLLEANGTLSCTRAVFPLFLDWLPADTPVGCEEGFVWHELPNGTIVPPHTGLLTVELTWTNSPTTPDPFTSRPELLYTPASTWRMFAPEGQQAESGRAVYTIPVDPKMVDSPYANVSEWAFALLVDDAAPTGQGGFFLGGIGAFEGTYALRIVAEREQLA